jgi:hypothetical protein
MRLGLSKHQKPGRLLSQIGGQHNQKSSAKSRQHGKVSESEDIDITAPPESSDDEDQGVPVNPPSQSSDSDDLPPRGDIQRTKFQTTAPTSKVSNVRRQSVRRKAALSSNVGTSRSISRLDGFPSSATLKRSADKVDGDHGSHMVDKSTGFVRNAFQRTNSRRHTLTTFGKSSQKPSQTSAPASSAAEEGGLFLLSLYF